MVEFPEFVDLMTRRPYGFRGSETELTAAFSPFDEYGTGIVNMGALRRALTSLGEPLRDDELDDMLGQAEVDGDGNVDYKGQGRSVTYSGVSRAQSITDAQMCFLPFPPRVSTLSLTSWLSDK